MGALCCSNQRYQTSNTFSKRDFQGVKVGNVNKDYFFEKQLGLGSYGEVKLGTNKKTGVKTAIKKIPIDPHDKELMNMIVNEI